MSTEGIKGTEEREKNGICLGNKATKRKRSWQPKTQNNMMKKQQLERCGARKEEEGLWGCLMYNKWPLAESWPFFHYHPSAPVSPLIPPCSQNTVPFALLFHFLFSQSSFLSLSPFLFSFLSAVFAIRTFTTSAPQFSSVVLCAIKFLSTHDLPSVRTAIGHLIRKAVSLTAVHLCACRRGITYFLCPLIKRCVTWDALKHNRWSSASQSFSPPSDKRFTR